MTKKSFVFRKSLVFVIIILFISASFGHSIDGSISISKNSRNIKTNQKEVNDYRIIPGNTGYETWYFYIAEIINSANGNLYLSNEDLSIKNRGADIEIIRSYNSYSSNKNTAFGYGWTFKFNTHLIYNTDYVIWVDEDGSNHNFIYLGNGKYQSPPGVHSRLIKNSDNSFTLWFKSGDKYNFYPDGRLKRLTDKNGNSIIVF